MALSNLIWWPWFGVGEGVPPPPVLGDQNVMGDNPQYQALYEAAERRRRREQDDEDFLFLLTHL